MSEHLNKNILLVEDDIIIAMAEKFALEKYGYVTRTVTTGDQAVKVINSSKDIDLVLMDINLGNGMDGTETAEIILRDHDLPIIFLSSHTEPEIVEKTEKITSYGYVVKNSSITVLDASIKMAFRLFEEKDRFRLLFRNINSVNSLYEVVPGKNGEAIDYRYLEVNPAFENLVGMKASELIGKTILEVFPHTERYWLEIFEQVYRTSEPVHYENYSQELDTYAELNIYIPKKGQLSMSSQDITKRKKAEIALQMKNKEYELLNAELKSTTLKLQKQNEDYEVINEELKLTAEVLQESEEKHRLLIENSHDIIYTLTTEGIFLFVSSAWESLLGHPVDQVVGTSFRQFIHPDDVAECLAWLKKVIETGTRQEGIEYRVQHIDGSWSWHTSSAVPLRDESGNIYGFEGLARDITERRNQIDILKKMLDSNSKMMTSLLDASFYKMALDTIDSITGARYSAFNIFAENGLEFTTVALNGINDKALNITSLLGFDPVNRKWKYDPIRAKKIKENTVTLFSSLSELTNYKLPAAVVKMIEKTFNIQEVVVIKVNMNDEPVGDFTLFFQKNTRMKNKELAEIYANQIGMFITRKRNESNIKNLLSEKELLLKEVHHRIKNNMNTVSSLLSLQAGAVSEPTAIMALEEAEGRINSMSLLYDKLYRSANFNDVSIKEYLSSMVDEVIANFPNNQIVKNKKTLQDFKLDSKRVQSIGIIINELLTNSMKYAFEKRESGLIEVSATKVKGHVAISVRDNGIGMPESVSFEKTTGFGLQLVQALAQQLKGVIRVERRDGTKVVLEFDV